MVLGVSPCTEMTAPMERRVNDVPEPVSVVVPFVVTVPALVAVAPFPPLAEKAVILPERVPAVTKIEPPDPPPEAVPLVPAEPLPPSAVMVPFRVTRSEEHTSEL